MRRSHLLIATSLAALALAIWLWPRGSSTSEEESSTAAQSSALESRRAARQAGTSSFPASVSGIVLDADTQAPLSAALISITRRRIDGGLVSKAGQRPAPLMTQTDAEGHFHIGDLAPGRYSVSTTKDRYKPQYLDGIVLEGGQDRDDLRFALASGGHLLTGVVTDIGGGAVPFAMVRARKFSDFSVSSLFRAPFTAVTNVDGEYEINLDDGSYQIEVFHTDYRLEDKGVAIGGQDRRVDFVLTPGSVIEGVVLRSSDDAPVAGATVTSNEMGQTGGFTVSGIAFKGGAETDADGRFTLGGLGSGAFELRAVAPHAASRQPTIVELAIAESITDVTVYVDEAFTISGFVVNTRDKSKAESDVMVGAYNFSPGAVFVATAPSASDGYFEIHGVKPGSFTVGAVAEERQPNFFGESVTVEDQDITDLVIGVDPGNTLIGQVQPPQEAEVTLRVDMEDIGISTMMQAAGAFLVRARSDKEGKFTLKGVGKGSYTVVATADKGDKGSLEIEVEGDMDGLLVPLEHRASAFGMVTDEGGHAVEGATIDFVAREGEEMQMFRMSSAGKSTITGADGRFEHVGLADGGFDVTVSDGAQLAWAGKQGQEALEPMLVTVKEGQDVRDLNLVVETRDHSIRGTVRGPDGAPLPDSWVTARWVASGEEPEEKAEAEEGERGARRRRGGWHPSESPVLTDENGDFEVQKLRAGLYDLTAEGLRGGAKGKAESVAVDTHVTIEIEHLGQLLGSVTKGGAPVKEFVVMVEGPLRRRMQVSRDDGSFRLSRLEPGEYQVEISATEGVASTTATVKTGEDSVQSIVLASFGSVSGVLVDAKTGEPMPDIAAIAGMGRDGGQWAKNAMGMMTGSGPRTDEEGRFHVGKLGAGDGQIYFFDPSAKGFATIAQKSFELEAGEDLDLGKLSGMAIDKVPKEDRGELGLRTEVSSYAESACAEQGVEAGELGDAQHLWIVEIDEDGPADRAGAKRCDRITSVQGIGLKDPVGPRELEMLLYRGIEIGSTVTVGVDRESGPTTLSIKATAAEES